ncbi:MAG: Omp28-related outer membrane protein [Dysgonamonadaceae bacterium]|nr:Omp28-related outer membrane protein [Dysgonamonadaceae bacterium]
MKLNFILICMFLSLAMHMQATENFIELRYCSDAIRPVSVGSMADIEAAVFIPVEVAKKYAGQHLTKIKVGLGSDRATNTKVFIRTNLEDRPVYEQSATFNPSVWNEITLDTPYEIAGNEGFYLGYSLTSNTYGYDYAIGMDDSSDTNPNGDLIRCKFIGMEITDWTHIGNEGLSNLCIMGIVEGDKPLRDIELYSLSAPLQAISANESVSISGKIKNTAVEAITSFDVGYKVDMNEKRTLSFTGLNIPPNGKFEFNISGIDFEKIANSKYMIEISVDKINGDDDEFPDDNIGSVPVWTWSIPVEPTIVTTQPLKKNAILEEYTGVNCVYCPEGHKIANQIIDDNKGRVSVINIHQGFFAVSYPNYKTEWGDALANQTGITGYPAGTINRHVFSGKNTILGRGNFEARTKTILNQDAYVNIAQKTTLNKTTRELIIYVELYYTDNGSPVNMLNIALLQDGVLGPQEGAEEYYPEMIIDDQYQHNHILRDLLTKQWGDSVKQTSAHTFIARKYIYTVPEKIGDIFINLDNIEIVAFVTEGTQEIINGTSTKFTGIETKLSDVEKQKTNVFISNGLLFINSTNSIQDVSLYTVSGQKVLSMMTNNEKVIPVATLAQGIYIVKLKTPEGYKTLKVIKGT